MDWPSIEDWLADRGIAQGAVRDIHPIGGGTQNLMFGFRCGERSFVLRRGPEHLRPHTNDALRREGRFLGALAHADVPIPQLIAMEPDESMLGSVFYLMDPVDGFNATVELPPLHAGDPQIQRAMGFHAVDALLKLGSVDHRQVGLGDVGRPDGFLERQVPQWLDALEQYSGFDGYPGHALPNIDKLARWLTGHRPPSFQPGIMHGDFHLANLMFGNDGPQVAAIVDWEMCTVADPLLDFGWLLATWPQGQPLPAPNAIGRAANLPTRVELVDRYAAGGQRGVDHAIWYAVMASFKLAIVLEGTNARAHAGKAPKPTGDLLHETAVGLLVQAAAFVEKGF